MNFKTLFLFGFLSVEFLACKKKAVPPCLPTNSDLSQQMLILNEGLFQQNNASMTLANIQTGETFQNYFQQVVGRPLGDTGNDMKRYGSKIYIVMNVSSTIEVLDAKTLVFIKQIQMQHNGVAKQPRHIDFFNDKALITCFDGYVDVIDTASLTLSKRIPVGSNPDHLRVAGNQLYVSNSGGLNFPLVDSTVSVISLVSLTETKKITVGKNPGSIAVGGNGDVYVVSRGDYNTIPSRMHRIETTVNTKIETYSFDVSSVEEMNGDLLVLSTNNIASVKLFDVQSNSIGVTDMLNLNGVSTPYSVQFLSETNKIYVMDANSFVNVGKVWEYDTSGNYTRNYSAGLIPSRVLKL